MADIHEILQQFELIDKKVEQVIQLKQQLTEENQALHDRIGQLENLLQEKGEAEKKHEELTLQVREKIDRLIGRLEGETER